MFQTVAEDDFDNYDGTQPTGLTEIVAFEIVPLLERATRRGRKQMNFLIIVCASRFHALWTATYSLSATPQNSEYASNTLLVSLS